MNYSNLEELRRRKKTKRIDKVHTLKQYFNSMRFIEESYRVILILNMTIKNQYTYQAIDKVSLYFRISVLHVQEHSMFILSASIYK